MEAATRNQLKIVRELLRNKKKREEYGMFAAEGSKIINDFIDKGHIPEYTIISTVYSEQSDNELFMNKLNSLSIKTFISNPANFSTTSQLKNTPGVVGVFKKPVPADIKNLTPNKGFLVLCDYIQDPGNLGAVIRSSLAFGAGAILLYGESADFFNPKVIRASSGVVLDIPFYKCTIKDIDIFKKKGFKICVSSLKDNKSSSIENLCETKDPLVVVFGNEGKGISRKIMELADKFFYIPVNNKVESLNVSAAAAITLYLLKGKKR